MIRIPYVAQTLGLALSLLLTPAVLATTPAPIAIVSDDCSVHSARGVTCSVTVDQLHPTQLTYGAIEVDRRAAKIADMSDSKRRAYLQNHVIPLVVGPQGVLYVTDHHHFAMAYAQVVGNDAAVLATIQENWAALTPASFWAQMAVAQYTYLYDEHGDGPLTPAALSADLFSLRDDPFRSLAWGVRSNDGYDDTTVPHADFQWANFLRQRFDAQAVTTAFDATVTQATAVAHSAAARGLPGYKAN
jgi:hypothetical protein